MILKDVNLGFVGENDLSRQIDVHILIVIMGYRHIRRIYIYVERKIGKKHPKI